MIDVAKAFRIIDREISPLRADRVELVDAVGRILAEKIIADTDLPPFDRSQMDGYAVIAADTENAPVTLELVGESAAGRGWHNRLHRGQAIRIMTGAPVPLGADAMQKVELAKESECKVTLLEPTETRRYIIKKGAEIKRGKTIFKPGEAITEASIAALAAFGYARVKVGKRPKVAIIGTGSEIVEISRKPGRDQIRNSNSVMLDVLCRKFGAEPGILPIAADDVVALKASISKAAKRSDVVLLTGGVSVGRYDHTKAALTELGAKIFFEKLRLKPGKPAVFAKLRNAFVFGLPGNPVSAAVTFHLFVRKAILLMQGAKMSGVRIGSAIAGGEVRGTRERDSYIPSRISTDASGHLVAGPLRWTGSSDLVGYAAADSLIVVPRGRTIRKGEVTEIVFL